MTETLNALIAELRTAADRAYCRYVEDAMRRELLLGAEAKLKAGRFTMENLNAYQEHSKLFGEHRGLMQAVERLSALAGIARPSPHEKDSTGSSNESRAQDTTVQGGDAGNAQSPAPVTRTTVDCVELGRWLRYHADGIVVGVDIDPFDETRVFVFTEQEQE